ncbi:M20 family metallopeptidase [Candidatus Chloroploca sp. Khr17]|uniref:M20 metallopeptidase family protein n=1 Tax=Candidatus Chloroploca sp. Khr17 TaxID=2496869 RepID=UPI00101DA588|nr:M20 family metallopeptidase [Candidatus Chloroploca sp. Khr17]
MLDRANALATELVRLRRDLHTHPELSFAETRTSALVADTLAEIGDITVRTGIARTGVVGELGPGGGLTIAIRADMDALPIIEANATPYASQHHGVMHACGHDAHTAMLLGAAHLLREQFANERLRGRVRFIFQPSEENWDDEGKSGGLRMVEEGVMEDVDAVIALHVDSTLPMGKVTIHGGWASAAVDDFTGSLLATGGHGAAPHEGTDPIYMLIPVLTALYGIKARRIDPIEPTILSVGVVEAQGASNVIPSEVRLQGTLRSYNPRVREQLISEVEKAFAVTRAFGGDYRLKIGRGYPAGWNDQRVAGWLEQVAGSMLGDDAFDHAPAGLGAEDFAYMCQKAPGAMLMLGAAIDDGVVRAHHTPIFDIDERSLPVGSAILAETALRFLRGTIRL